MNSNDVDVPGSATEQGEAARLQALRELQLMNAPPQERLERITRMACSAFGMPMAAVTLVDSDRQFAVSQQGPADLSVPRDESFCAHTMQDAQAMVVPDAQLDSRFADNPLVTGDPRLRFYAGFPLTVGAGHRVGALCVLDTAPRVFSAEQVALLAEMARWVERELAAAEELDRATATQDAFTPRRPPELAGFNGAALAVPMVGLRGDFATWRSLRGSMELTLGDVMATGPAAGLNAASVRATVNAVSFRGALCDVVRHTNRLLEEQLDRTESYATVVHAQIHDSGLLRLVDAGHGMTLIVRAAGGHEHLGTPDLPLGVVPGSGAGVREAHLEVGDALVLFTDGLMQLWDGSIGHLAELAAIIRTAPTMQNALDVLVQRAAAQGHPQGITVLAVRRQQ